MRFAFVSRFCFPSVILFVLCLLFCSVSPFKSVLASDISMDTAVLGMLDKITGRTSTVNAKIGEEFDFGSLIVKADVCKTRPPEETPENIAFLEIDNISPAGKIERIFSGFMFSSSPALSALDNSMYDIWVIKCAGKKIAGEKELKPVQKEVKGSAPVVYIEENLPKEKVSATDDLEVIVEENVPEKKDTEENSANKKPQESSDEDDSEKSGSSWLFF